MGVALTDSQDPTEILSRAFPLMPRQKGCFRETVSGKSCGQSGKLAEFEWFLLLIFEGKGISVNKSDNKEWFVYRKLFFKCKSQLLI